MITIKSLLISIFVLGGALWYTTTEAIPLRQENTSNKNDDNKLLSENNNRDLQSSSSLVSGNIFFGQSIFCVSTGGGTYSNRLRLRIFEWFYINWFGDIKGSCGSQCDDICNHQPCIDDARVNSAGNTCTCVSNPQSFCGTNTNCVDDECECQTGFNGNPLIAAGNGCVDINECSNSELNNCGPNTNCINTPGSYNCECKSGYAGDPTSTQGCTNINECTTTPDICGPNGTCEDTVGSYICNCNTGYGNSVPTGVCQNINECLSSACGPNANCVDTDGSFTCSCKQGYTGTPPTQVCTDVNECTTTPDICGPNASCTNTPGSYTCACNIGYIGTPPSQPCTPDSCTAAGFICQVNSQCDTSSGAAVCQCNRGYTGDPLVGCTDIDECQDPNFCPATQNCFNNVGGYQCLIKAWESCPSGNDNTCSPNLQCARTSRTDETLVCCAETGSCSGTRCCNGAYAEGERCPSRNSDDCAGNLQCGRAATDIINPTFRCCNAFINDFGIVICSI